MGRIVYCPIESITIAAGGDVDIFELATGSGNKVRLLGWEINSSSVEAVATELKLCRGTATGSGGSPQPVGIEALADEDDGAITASVKVNNTTPGTDGVSLQHFGWEQLGPLGIVYTPEMAPVIAESSFLKLNLITNTAFECNGWLCWEEI